VAEPSASYFVPAAPQQISPVIAQVAALVPAIAVVTPSPLVKYFLVAPPTIYLEAVPKERHLPQPMASEYWSTVWATGVAAKAIRAAWADATEAAIRIGLENIFVLLFTGATGYSDAVGCGRCLAYGTASQYILGGALYETLTTSAGVTLAGATITGDLCCGALTTT